MTDEDFRGRLMERQGTEDDDRMQHHKAKANYGESNLRYPDTTTIRTNRKQVYRPFFQVVKSQGLDVCYVTNNLWTAYTEAAMLGKAINLATPTPNTPPNNNPNAQHIHYHTELHLHSDYIVDRPRRKPTTSQIVRQTQKEHICDILKELSAREKSELGRVLPLVNDLASKLNQTEKAVVVALLEHYAKTNSKFILVKDKFHLSQRIGANVDDLGEALAHLVEDNLVYKYSIRGEGYSKIGLKKDFLNSLAAHPEASTSAPSCLRTNEDPLSSPLFSVALVSAYESGTHASGQSGQGFVYSSP